MRGTAERVGGVSLLALCGLWAGCSGASDAPPEYVFSGDFAIHDSAGTSIVENREPAWDPGAEWTITAEPTLDIGELDGAPEYTFGTLRNVVRLSDDHIVAADMQVNKMRFYDASGRHLMSVGRTGQGPGEFQQLYRMLKIEGDSLMALNPVSLTSIFAPDGEFVRRFELDPVPDRYNLWWIGDLSGGSLLAYSLQREGTRYGNAGSEGSEGRPLRIIRPERDGFYRDTLMHFLFTMEGHLIDSVAKLPGQFIADNRVFAPNAAYATFGDAFYHSPGDVVEIRKYRSLYARGSQSSDRTVVRLEQIARRPPLGDLTVTDAIKERYIEDRGRANEEYAQVEPRFDLAQANRRLAATPFPERLPAHGNRMYLDPSGDVWLQEYRMDETEPFRWSVFDPNGRWLGVVETPARFTVNEIGDDYVLGVFEDELDVQHVRMYGLVKPG